MIALFSAVKVISAAEQVVPICPQFLIIFTLIVTISLGLANLIGDIFGRFKPANLSHCYQI